MGRLPPDLIGFAGHFRPIASFIEMAATLHDLPSGGRNLEARAKGRASEAIKRLIMLVPRRPRFFVTAKKGRGSRFRISGGYLG